MECFFPCRDEEVIAAAGLNFDPAVSAVAERLATGKVITKDEAQYVKTFSLFYTLFLYSHLLIILVKLNLNNMTPERHVGRFIFVKNEPCFLPRGWWSPKKDLTEFHCLS